MPPSCAPPEDRAVSVGRRHPQRRILSRRIAGAGGEGISWAIQLPLHRLRRRLYGAGWRPSCTAAEGQGALSAANKALTDPTIRRCAACATTPTSWSPRAASVRPTPGRRSCCGCARGAELAGVRADPVRRGGGAAALPRAAVGGCTDLGGIALMLARLSAGRHHHGVPLGADTRLWSERPEDRPLRRRRLRLCSSAWSLRSWPGPSSRRFGSAVSAGVRSVPFLSLTFAPLSLGAFAVLVVGYVIAA